MAIPSKILNEMYIFQCVHVTVVKSLSSCFVLFLLPCLHKKIKIKKKRGIEDEREGVYSQVDVFLVFYTADVLYPQWVVLKIKGNTKYPPK